jgi:xylulokinase
MYLGVDIGTSSVKAVLVDDGDRIVAMTSRALHVARPQPGFSEQDPEGWWQATLGVIDELAAVRPAALAATRGIGLSGQMHGAVLLDRAGRVLRPAILWNDGRSAAECQELEERLPRLHAVTGNLAMPGFTAPKLLWIRKHQPAIFAAIHKVLLPKAYVRWRLCGETVEDMSDASGTLWLDVGCRDWSDDALAATGLAREHMPDLVEGTAAAGVLAHDLAARWGMTKPPVIAGGAGDNAASAVGLGAVAPGSAFLSLGTSGVLWATTARFAPNPASAVHAFCHAVPDTWHQMGVILSAASALSWVADLFGVSEADLLDELGERVAGPSPVLFLPYLAGERTPHNDAGLRGVLMGLGFDTGRSTLAQAVLEGVAFAFRDCLLALGEAGTTIAAADVVGGGARSRLWVGILASVLGIPLALVAEGETGAAAGAARLARVAVGDGTLEAVCIRRPVLSVVEPEPNLMSAYMQRYEDYRAALPAARLSHARTA